MCRTDHLHLRSHGYVWRRRVPARCQNFPDRAFFCFSTRTHVLREAAEIGRRLTVLSDLCFHAETDVPPELMTRLLTSYARFEIKAADRLRALTGRRTREAAEATMAIEAATRASLRDAIFLGDHRIAAAPIQDTARRLGLPIDEAEEDYAVLADRMLRLMIELSDERERRARGVFAEPQPYLGHALAELSASPWSAAPLLPIATSQPAATDDMTHLQDPVEEHDDAVPFLESDALDVRLAPASVAQTASPTLLSCWDAWFDSRMRGEIRSGAYVLEDRGKAARFAKDADTTRATRKLIADLIGDREISSIRPADWSAFTDMIRRIPANHGKSAADRHLSYAQVVAAADRKESQQKKAAEARIRSEKLQGDEADAHRRGALVPRLSPRTFQRHQKYLSAPLDHAVASGVIPFNPYKPYVLGETVIAEMRKGAPDTSRRLWHGEFDQLLATTKWNDVATAMDDPIYWVPLIARLSGMRSEEILQLTPGNIRNDGDIHYFDIEKGAGQELKSENGRRMVPIHSQLIALGLLELVVRQKQRGRSRLFDSVQRAKAGKRTYTAVFDKRFLYYRRSVGCYSPRQDMHSLRTTFHSDLVTASVPDTARRYLMGHQNDDIGIVNYLPEGFPLSTLSGYVEQLSINVSAIKRRFCPDLSYRKSLRLVTVDGHSRALSG